MLCSNDAELIRRADYSQPLCTALQIALVNLIAKCGIVPIAIVGHSSGEIAGAYAAKALSAKEAITSSYYRGLVTKRQTRKGAMMAVGMSKEAVSSYLVGGVVVGCENSPQSVTLSGDEEAIEKVLENLKSKDPNTFTRRLHVNVAYHSCKPLSQQLIYKISC